jgi:GNAT superfamily N-acetyltransferase
MLVDGVPVGHAWVTRPVDHEHIVNNYTRLKAGECLIHYCYVHPDYRGLGYYSEMLHAVTLWALGQGATQVRVDNGADNMPSQ